MGRRPASRPWPVSPTRWPSFTVSVDGSASSDPDGNIVEHRWSFGDGSAEQLGPTGSHTYAAPGSYLVTLSVVDAAGASSSSAQLIEVVEPTAGPPGTVGDLEVAATSSSRITLRFTEVGDGTGAPAKYDVRYGTPTIGWGDAPSVLQGSCATPMAGVAIGNVRTCTVEGLSDDTPYQLQLVAFRGTLDVDAVFGGLSNVASGTTPSAGDTSPPAVALSAPGDGATVSGTITVSAAATDDVGVAGVRFQVDGVDLGGEDTSSPFSVLWNTLGNDGPRTLVAIARDAAGNVTRSASRTMTVSNGTTPPATATLTASPTSIVSGQSSTLTWSSTDATSCTASGAWSGSLATSGSQSVSPTSTSTYTLSCTGAGGSSAPVGATITVGSPPPPGGGTWPNEPSGHTVTVDMAAPFTIPLADQPAGAWDYSDWSFNNLSVVNGNLRFTFPAGFEGSAGPIRAVIADTSLAFQDYYVGILIRYSQPWTRHPTLDKIIYWGELTANNPNAGQVFVGRGWGHNRYIAGTLQANQGGFEVCPIRGDSARNPPCDFSSSDEPFYGWLAGTVLDDGAWHRVELVARGSTSGQANGYFAAYVDGKKGWEYSNVKWTNQSLTRFHGINLDPVWGGGDGVFKPQTEWLELGAIRVSGR